MKWFAGAGLVLLLTGASARAGAPTLDGLFPAGGPLGASISLFAADTLGTNTFHVWTDDTNLVFRPAGTNGEFQVAIGTNVTVGPHWVRAFNAQGVSAPRLFVVGEVPELTYFEPPADADTNVLDQFPLTINIRLRRPVETNLFTLRLSGQPVLQARLVALGLDSPVKATLTLLDAAGRRLSGTARATNSDPVLSCPVEQDGIYRLRVAARSPADDSKTNAVIGAVYRLTLTAEPPAPLTGPTNENVMDPNIIWPALSEPWLTFPCTVHGILNPPGNEDIYPFDARAGERYTFSVDAASLGSPLAAVILVWDNDHREVGRSVPAGDPVLNWTAPQDGRYAVIVTDAQRNGGMDYAYVINFQPPELAFNVSVPAFTFTVVPGGGAVVPVQVTRPADYEGLLNIVVAGLRDGVTAAPAHSTAEVKDAVLTLNAAPDATPGGAAFRVVAFTLDPTSPQSVVAKAPVQGRYAPAGGLLLNTIDQFWLTVTPKPKP